MKLPRQAFRLEFRKLAIRRVKDGEAMSAVATTLGLIGQAVRNWVKAEATGKLTGAGTRAVTHEEMELCRLKAENAKTRQELELIKRATACFARDTL